MKYESNNYELAKQDREGADRNLVVEKSDLANLRPLPRKNTDMSGKQEDQQENARTGDRQFEIDEELIKEMCQFSNMSTANNVKKQSANGVISRVNGGGLQSSVATKNVVEDFAISLDGDQGTNGRPRVREEIKLPPVYENIDLNDPND